MAESDVPVSDVSRPVSDVSVPVSDVPDVSVASFGYASFLCFAPLR